MRPIHAMCLSFSLLALPNAEARVRSRPAPLLLAAGLEAAEKVPRNPLDAKYDPQANPTAGLKTAFERASHEGKSVLLDIGGEWCIWCHQLDRFIGDHDELLELLQTRYVVLKVNYSPENKNTEFLSHCPKITGFPFLMVLNAEGKLLGSAPPGGLGENNTYNVEKVRAFLEKYAAK